MALSSDGEPFASRQQRPSGNLDPAAMMYPPSLSSLYRVSRGRYRACDCQSCLLVAEKCDARRRWRSARLDELVGARGQRRGRESAQRRPHPHDAGLHRRRADRAASSAGRPAHVGLLPTAHGWSPDPLLLLSPNWLRADALLHRNERL